MAKQDDKTVRELRSIRDTVESVWVAIVLAFVLRAFMIEAFVIPTGSMAPRLMGEHWSLACPACGYEYSYGLDRRNASVSLKKLVSAGGAACPNCSLSFPATTYQDYARGGDRVLVMKYLYNFADPQPWDVVVFRNPQDNRENYIKRLIGLPGETIEIVHGDIFVRSGEGPWQIRRKPRAAQEAMWQVVFDNDYRPEAAMLARRDADASPRPRWAAPQGLWDLSPLQGRRFTFPGSSQPAEVVFEGGDRAFLPNYGYNRVDDSRYDMQRDIVSDLKLSFVYTPQADNSVVSIVLSSFELRFKGELHADGTAAIWYDPADQTDGNWVEWGRAQAHATAPGQSRLVALTHADFRLSLWVDGCEVLQSTDEQYAANHDALIARMRRIDRQWAPVDDEEAAAPGRQLLPAQEIPAPQVKIAAEGGPCSLEHVKLERDVYYTCSQLGQPSANGYGDFAKSLGRITGLGWGTTGQPITLRKFPDNPELDQFFMMGDNSPQSHDGRSWTDASPTLVLRDEDGKQVYQLGTVPRYNLIGKAFFVYWPAGYPVPGLPGLPIIPNAGKMRLIR